MNFKEIAEEEKRVEQIERILKRETISLEKTRQREKIAYLIQISKMDIYKVSEKLLYDTMTGFYSVLGASRGLPLVKEALLDALIEIEELKNKYSEVKK